MMTHAMTEGGAGVSPPRGWQGGAQEEMPLAMVQGVAVLDVPRDLHIPPHALEVFLDAFEGPLDLLLYLIRRQNIDILNIPIAEITQQYARYIELMEELQLDLAGEYLVMAAMLAEIKSRMLLPRPATEEEEEEDPRAALVRRLQEYERYKDAASRLDALPRCERDIFAVLVDLPNCKVRRKAPELSLNAVLKVFADVLSRVDLLASHRIAREPLSVRERMACILERASAARFTDFAELCTLEEGRAGVIVTLLAVLELMREQLLELVQNEDDGAIHVRAAA